MRVVLACCLLLASLAWASPDVTCGTGSYDFSSLTKTSGTDYTVSDGNGYTYDFNVCGASTRSDQSCNNEKGAVCQYDSSSKFVAVVAKWNDQDITWNVNGDDVELSFANGDVCFPTPNPRTAQIVFKCDESHEVGTLSMQSTSCNYVISFPTKLACGGHGPGKSGGGGGGGLSGGSVFVIIFFVVVPVYIAAGCFWNYRKSQGAGNWRDWCPNQAFWFAIPGLVKDGCVYTYAKIKALITGGGPEEEGYTAH